MRYIQVAVPSRGEVDSYQRFKRQVEESVGRINGACGTLRSTPVHYMHQSVSERQLVALYRAADVMLVTPLRDGMNLVAKEFVASRVDDDGVLVLSEFAGAAAELDGAVVVNPYDVDAVAEASNGPVNASDERRARMKNLRQRVGEYDIHPWAADFLAALDAARPTSTAGAIACRRPAAGCSRGVARRRSAPAARLRRHAGAARPLAGTGGAGRGVALAARGTGGVAGRAPSNRQRTAAPDPGNWFGHLPVGLWAEHGFWHRPSPQEPWPAAATVDADWTKQLLPILEQFTDRTPGSEIEFKSASVAWHYRRAQREFGARQAHELRMLLGDALSNQPLEVLEGRKSSRSGSAASARRSSPTRASDRGGPADHRIRRRSHRRRSVPRTAGHESHRRRRPALASARFRVADYRAVRQLLRLLAAPAAADGGLLELTGGTM